MTIEKVIFDEYNNNRGELPKAEKLTTARQRAIRARVAEWGEEAVIETVKLAGKTKFLQGYNERGWRANFDWIFNPNNFCKIRERAYENSNKKPYKQNQRGLDYGQRAYTDEDIEKTITRIDEL